jgi:hypothetical protein
MLSVIMLSVIMLSVIMLSVIMLSVFMLSVIMLSVIMLNVIMLNVICRGAHETTFSTQSDEAAVLLAFPSLDIREYIDCSMVNPASLFWLSNSIASHQFAVAPQSGAKDFIVLFTT